MTEGTPTDTTFVAKNREFRKNEGLNNREINCTVLKT